MTTLRKALQDQIDSLNAQSAAVSANLQNNITTFDTWLDEDPATFKAKVDAYFAEVTKHVGQV